LREGRKCLPAGRQEALFGVIFFKQPQKSENVLPDPQLQEGTTKQFAGSRPNNHAAFDKTSLINKLKK